MKTVEIYVPKFDNDGTSNKAVIESTIHSLIDLYGGCTTIDAVGYWKDEGSETLYKDEITIIQSSTVETASERLLKLAKGIMDVTDQKAVFIKDGDVSEIISKDD